jgi:hypothetical protein
MGRSITKLFRAFWPLGLFVFYSLIVLSFENIDADQLAIIFGSVVVGAACLAWLIIDWVKPSESRVKSKLADMEDLLRPYEGMSLKEMPPEVQAEVRRRLGWSEPVPPAPPSPPASPPNSGDKTAA